MRPSGLSDNKIEENIMIPENNCFISNPSYLNSIKCDRLRKFMMLGASLTTPIEKKATFNWSYKCIEGKGDFVTSVTYFPPNSNLPGETFNLDEHTRIPLITWCRMMSQISDYSDIMQEYKEKERKHDIVKRFEEAAKKHGATQRSVGDGNIGEHHAYESGKALRELRKELYEELGYN